MPRAPILAVLASVFLVQEAAGDAAHPVHFRVAVYEGPPRARVYDWKPGASFPTSLSGWACKMGDRVELTTDDQTGVVWQNASFSCTSAGGSVESPVGCLLTSNPEGVKTNGVTIRDSAGHSAKIIITCDNLGR